MKNKVCLITTVHQAFDIRIFHKQAQSLSKAGYAVSLIATYNKEEIVDGVRIIPIPKATNRFKRIFGSTLTALKLALKQDADIYHFHDPELYLLEVFIKILKRKPVIHDAHEHYSKDILAKEWIPEKYRKLYLFVFEAIEKFSLNFIDAVVYVVPDIKNRYSNFKGEFLEIRNYPKLELFNCELNQNERNHKKVIFIGGLTPVRGITELVAAFSCVKQKIPDAKLDLLGPISVKYKQKLQTIINERDLNENITFYGQIPVNKLNYYVSKASIGIVPYLPITENNVIGLPNKIFEYMSCGCAVVCSNFPLYKEIVEDNKCGFTIDPTNPEEIAEKIIYLIQNPDKAREFGENGYKAVEEKYNWENEAQKFLDLYKSLIEKNKNE
jgi:glycosyltransferase involved in cell wall biosynthesis